MKRRGLFLALAALFGFSPQKKLKPERVVRGRDSPEYQMALRKVAVSLPSMEEACRGAKYDNAWL